jgi:hypothetical protein
VEAWRRDVPLLISIGYAACHWRHVKLVTSGVGSRADWVLSHHSRAVDARAFGNALYA